MEINQDFSDLFAAFNENGVEYLVVGAHALAAHGHVRATKDIDVWIRASTGNAPRVIAALKDFGAPVRIDILTEVDGLVFDEAWTNRIETSFGEQPCYVLSKEDLIKNKRASGRPQDLVDVERLENE